MSNTDNVDITRKDLKIQALLEKISSLTAQYENQVSDLRVELTLVSSELEQLKTPAGDDGAEEAHVITDVS